MIIIKNFIYNILSLFVFLRFKNISNLYYYLNKHNIKSGINASVFIRYLDKKGSYIGINSSIDNWPYFPHGLNGIFISNTAHIGKNAVIFQQVTIGSITSKGSKNIGSPIIGDNCYIGAGAKIIGNIRIGNNVRIGANAVVTQNVKDNASVYAQSTIKITKKKEKNDNNFYITNDQNELTYFDFETRKFKKVK